MNEVADIAMWFRTAEELTEPVTIGVEAYISEEYARQERDKLWRKVWQQSAAASRRFPKSAITSPMTSSMTRS